MDYRSGETLINKDYVGHYETKMAKFKCDSSSTKAEMIGKSLKIAIQQFEADLVEVVKRIR